MQEYRELPANRRARQRLQGVQAHGHHRDTFYEGRRAFQVGGVAALIEERRGPRNPHPNRVAPEIEEKILD
jgi:hypothetical protein